MKTVTVTYIDYFDEEQTEKFYFNLSQSELLDLISERGEHFGNNLVELAERQNSTELWTTIKDFVDRAYGERSEDGKRFVKSAEKLEEFRSSAAYDAVLEEILGTEDGVKDFILGVFPAKLRDSVKADLA